MPSGVYERTAETKAKISAARKGVPKSADTKAKIADSLTGLPKSPSHRAHLAVAARARIGERNGNWRGDNISYMSAHRRAKEVLSGQPCAHADDTCKGQLEAAFSHGTPAEFVRIAQRTGYRYSVRVEDYMRLCGSHHKRYDHANRNRKEEER
ncbi:MAG: hypothetical protein GEU73_04940 [Chloroflexi bacterium]|nr:hypothetical protein [Chloroflexota bacterium]